MLIDDTNDKLRRNLVVLSFLIIVGSYADICIQQEGRLFSVINYTDLSYLKFWTILLAVQGYVSLRYWFDNNRKKDNVLAKNEYKDFEQKLILLFLKQDFKNAILKRKMPRWIANFQELDNQELKIHYEEWGLPSKISLTITLQKDEVNDWNGWLGKAYSVEWEKRGHFSTTGGFRYQYMIGSVAIWIIKTIASIKHITFSKANVDFYIPILLATIAIGACLLQIIDNFY